MPYDYSKLRGIIKEVFGNEEISRKPWIYLKEPVLEAARKRGWKQDQIAKACKLLGIQEEDIPLYFFTLKVQRS